MWLVQPWFLTAKHLPNRYTTKTYLFLIAVVLISDELLLWVFRKSYCNYNFDLCNNQYSRRFVGSFVHLKILFGKTSFGREGLNARERSAVVGALARWRIWKRPRGADRYLSNSKSRLFQSGTTPAQSFERSCRDTYPALPPPVRLQLWTTRRLRKVSTRVRERKCRRPFFVWSRRVHRDAKYRTRCLLVIYTSVRDGVGEAEHIVRTFSLRRARSGESNGNGTAKGAKWIPNWTIQKDLKNSRV